MQATKDVIKFETTDGRRIIVPLNNLLSIEESDRGVLEIHVSYKIQNICFIINGNIQDWWNLFKNKEQLDVETS